MNFKSEELPSQCGFDTHSIYIRLWLTNLRFKLQLFPKNSESFLGRQEDLTSTRLMKPVTVSDPNSFNMVGELIYYFSIVYLLLLSYYIIYIRLCLKHVVGQTLIWSNTIEYCLKIQHNFLTWGAKKFQLGLPSTFYFLHCEWFRLKPCVTDHISFLCEV